MAENKDPLEKAPGAAADPAVDPTTDPEYRDFVAETETGARRPGGIAALILTGVALAWALMQLWFASPLPFVFNFAIFNDTEQRALHLAFAIFLAYAAYPAFRTSPRSHVPVIDWIIALVAAFCAAYIFFFYRDLAQRPGSPTPTDVWVSVVGMVLLLEATRRALGPPLMIVAMVFLGYTFLGAYMPEVIAHRGASLNKGMSHYWLGTEGVFGVALGVSTTMVFLFVLFGALLERAGAGNYFIRVAFSLLGHMRGGPAKAAVVSSAMTGLISGSSIANVVTTGTFTIPLMKKVGLSPEKAGAVEVASSTNGQLTPPVMGAAAFLMVEYVGISYIEVMKHAILPALISYIALVYIVHLEALKLGLKGMEREVPWPVRSAIVQVFMSFFAMVILSFIVYYAMGWIGALFGDWSGIVATALALVAYVGLVKYAMGVPELKSLEDVTMLPPPGPTIRAGLYYLLPVVVLVWNLMIERLSPGLSAFWAAVFMIIIIVTQRPLKSLMGRGGAMMHEAKEGLVDLREGLVAGSRNMIGIGVATAAAGIVVGTVTLTGVGLVMADFVDFISGGNLMLMLIFTAMISLLLGMGLPTTANYIVVATLMAPVIVTLASESGLLVPLIAAHMFVFYFGILADDTPPVGLAAFAAAAIAKSDPIKTGIQGFTYDMRTAILPFLFIFNTELLLIGVNTFWYAFVVFAFGVTAMFAFAAATQGHFLVRNRVWETLALLLVAFTLFRPGFWWDMIYPPLEGAPATEIAQIAERVPPGGQLRIVASGVTLEGQEVTRHIALRLGDAGAGQERVEAAGLTLSEGEGGVMIVDDVGFGSQAERAGLDFGWEIEEVQIQTERPPRQIMYIPALLLYGLIAWLQVRRRRREQHASAPSTA
ncbi:MAG: C4-dicarboxylate ABC transporter [Rhodospirillaceae bacterium BRH_c57]|nr:MAG: C4-dicarboxylate ABC transporter [Rhodospirillaceae bacterium BRH_c57]